MSFGPEMRLKHLQLQGYKTFATKTEFLFRSGITAIIGPNGSGKSNIIDAIRWVLGEQSYSALRGKRTEDMIFSGSQGRARAGMAEVILTLDNSDGWLPVEFSEVTISRRAFRDSQNEYRVNGSRVRLRDISELLSQSGLSRRTYTVIGQGLVDSVLALRAQDRRELFEEAAGIAHYREKRDDALRKLDETQRNLERVYDIITEIEPRLNRLERQAERTREYEGINSHLEQLLRIWYGYRWGQALAAQNQAQRIASQRTEQYKERAQRLETVTEEIARIRQAHSNLRQQITDWQRQNSDVREESEQCRRELAVLAERLRQLSAQRAEHVSECAALDARASAQTDRVALAQVDLEAAQNAMAECERDAQVAQSAFDARTAQRESLVRSRNSALEELAEIRAKIADRRSRWDSLEERIETLLAQDEAHKTDVDRLNESLGKLSGQIGRVDSELSLAEGKHEQERRTAGDLKVRRQRLLEQLERELSVVRSLRETEADVSARFELLSQLRRDYSVYGEAAGSLLAQRPDGQLEPAVPGLKGFLAQMLHLPIDDPIDLAAAVEAALGVYAGAVVVESWRRAQGVLEYLKANSVRGRIVLLPLNVPQGLDKSRIQIDAELPQDSLAARIRCEPELRPLVDRLLGRTYLVPDLDTAHSRLADLPFDAVCVTPGGDVLRSDGTVEGGLAAERVQPIGQEQEWSRLNAKRVQVGARREAAEDAARHTQVALESIQEDVSDSDLRLEGLAAQMNTTRALREKLVRQMDRLNHEIDWRQAQSASADADQHLLRQRQAALKDEIGELTQALASVDDAVREISANLEELPVDRLGEDLTTAQIALAAARQNCEGQQKVFHELETSLNHSLQEREAHRQRIAELTDEENKVNDRTALLNETQLELNAQLETVILEIQPAEERLRNLAEELARLETRERSDAARLREFESHLNAARLDLQRREDAVSQLRIRIEEDLGLVELELGPTIWGQTPLPLHPLVSKLPVVKRLPEGVEDEIKRLRAQMRRLGAINPNAPDEYKELQERCSFLQEQSTDLIAASDSLHKVIAEMDALIEHAFRQTFDAVAAEFSDTFTELFGGGKARLVLSEPDDLTHTGVEIVAQPPGKRLQALASLSGGERALTAVALIFAILRVSPTPFCILDEVDAMLDEANIGRFRAMLESLTESTQIIIITHNRGTINSADTVYGISMGADSVSQVLSVRMDEEKMPEA
jgi:chromosome segregation protein